MNHVGLIKCTVTCRMVDVCPQSSHDEYDGICFSVFPSSKLLSRSENSQLICLLPVGIFNYVTFV